MQVCCTNVLPQGISLPGVRNLAKTIRVLRMYMPCRLLETLFMTTVKLEAPMSGSVAEQHRNQLAEDAKALTAEHNLRELERMHISK